MATAELTIVGTGIRPSEHLTPESARAIGECDFLLHLIPDSAAQEYVLQLATGDSLDASTFYMANQALADSYNAMIARAMQALSDNATTCFALYGHPGVIVYPSHRLLRVAHDAGYRARMLPGVSAEDCLFADLGIDPASQGCQSYWATDLLLNHRQLDPTVPLIAWSIGVVGCSSYADAGMPTGVMHDLLSRLYQVYPPTHMVVVYEAATVAGERPRSEAIPLSSLPHVKLDGASTLYIPPALPTRPDWPQYARYQFPAGAVTEIFRSNTPITDHS